jgi:hypothetical protein
MPLALFQTRVPARASAADLPAAGVYSPNMLQAFYLQYVHEHYGNEDLCTSTWKAVLA